MLLQNLDPPAAVAVPYISMRSVPSRDTVVRVCYTAGLDAGHNPCSGAYSRARMGASEYGSRSNLGHNPCPDNSAIGKSEWKELSSREVIFEEAKVREC